MPPTDTADECCAGADCTLLGTEQTDALTEVFKALADPTRIRLLQYLACSTDGTACACHLPSALGISQPTLSFHLHKLLDAGLVTREKRGRWVHWSVAPDRLATASAFLDRPQGPTCGPEEPTCGPEGSS